LRNKESPAMSENPDRQSNPPDDKPGKDTPSTMPPAGPHAREDLIDNEKTPGTGSLPDPQGGEADVGSD
jgi:hypothetical protein